MPRAHTWFTIPAGRKSRKCGSCGARMFWIQTAGGTALPVDLAAPESVAPTADAAGRGLAHFASCPHANNDRTPRRAASSPRTEATP